MIAKATARSAKWRRRGDNTLRFIAAAPVGYLVASVWAAALARLLPGTPIGAATAGALIALALCAASAMYAYAARSGARALGVLLAFAGVAACIVWLSIRTSGRL